MWSEEGGPIYNTRFDMMGQQIELFFKSYFGRPGSLDDDPALINNEGEKVYAVSNTWLQIGRKKGIHNMLWTMAFSIYSIVFLLKAWRRSRDVNKYAVFSAFVGITFLNMVEPIIFNNVIFWALEVYLAGMSRALYNVSCSPKRLSAGISFSYV